jgi:stress response protein YsnF
MKEVLVKRILLVEEIRITKKSVQSSEQQEVTLRKEKVHVERVVNNNQ